MFGHKFGSSVAPYAFFGHLAPKFLCLLLQAPLVSSRRLLRALLQLLIDVLALAVQLLGKLHELVLGHAAVATFRSSLAHGLIAELARIGCVCVLWLPAVPEIGPLQRSHRTGWATLSGSLRA